LPVTDIQQSKPTKPTPSIISDLLRNGPKTEFKPTAKNFTSVGASASAVLPSLSSIGDTTSLVQQLRALVNSKT